MRHIAIDQDQSGSLTFNELSDVGIDDLLGQLRNLSVRLSSALRPRSADDADGELIHTLVKDVLRFRRLRNKLLGGDLFGEPAWDILLELFAADWSGEKLSVSGACYVSGVPSSTALRWIVRLENEGWVERTDDPLDGRRTWLTLTSRAERTIRDFLRQMAAGFAQAAQHQPF